MENGTKTPQTGPLGDLDFSNSVLPLGGINPHNEHFDSIGKQFLSLLIEHTGLRHNHKLLDLGCGTGRLAKQALKYIGKGYVGVDINRRFLDYCRTTYDGKFVFWDLQHSEFNQTGILDPSQHTFDFPKASFDVVCAMALFNHNSLGCVTRYLEEAARILKPRGKLFATFLFWNDRTARQTATKDKPPFQFSHSYGESRCDFQDRPLFNIAHPEQTIRRTLIQNGMMIKEPIRYGQWCGSTAAITGHDVLLACKGAWR